MICKLRIIDNLPFVELKVKYKEKEITLENAHIDTGSAKSILKGKLVEKIGIKPEPQDILGSYRGIGGSEYIYIKKVNTLAIGDLQVDDFKVDIGEMDYGFNIDAIVGMDFLQETGTIIDLKVLCIRTKNI